MNGILLCIVGVMMASLSSCDYQDRNKEERWTATWEPVKKRLLEYENTISSAPFPAIQTVEIHELVRYLDEQKRTHLSPEEGPGLSWCMELIDVATQENVAAGKWREEGRKVEVRLQVFVSRSGSREYEELVAIKVVPMDKSSLLFFLEP